MHYIWVLESLRNSFTNLPSCIIMTFSREASRVRVTSQPIVGGVTLHSIWWRMKQESSGQILFSQLPCPSCMKSVAILVQPTKSRFRATLCCVLQTQLPNQIKVRVVILFLSFSDGARPSDRHFYQGRVKPKLLCPVGCKRSWRLCPEICRDPPEWQEQDIDVWEGRTGWVSSSSPWSSPLTSSSPSSSSNTLKFKV